MLLATIVILTFSALIYYFKSINNYFKNKGVCYEEPYIFLGNAGKLIFGKENLFETVSKVSTKFKDQKYVGFYKFLTPVLVINDAELVGQMLVKDFQHFSDNDLQSDENIDFIAAKNLLFLKGHKWRTMKSLLTPMFTTLKLKSVYPMMEDVGERFVEFICNQIEAGSAECIDGKSLCLKFTTENVASTVFGLQGNTFASSAKESEFVKVARDFGDPTLWNSLKVLLVFMMPILNNVLRVKMFSKEAEDYLTGVIKETLKYRKENNIIRHDFLDMISSLKEKSTEFKFEDRDVVAQAAGFFIDGVETTASVLSYVLYELAANPDVQEKLRQEITDIKEYNKGRVPYQRFIELDHMDCVINETLRKNPPVLTLAKVCTKSYKLPPAKEGGQEYPVKVGDSIFIPVEAIHKNPDYYPEPEKFIPDRFFNENKTNLTKHAFIPFGEGPRACLGMRFGMTQIKVAVIALLSHFKVEINEKTENPLGVSAATLVRHPINGFWFRFKKL